METFHCEPAVNSALARSIGDGFQLKHLGEAEDQSDNSGMD
jgi:hypothetical protein